jgi:hypothetical protein
MNTFLILQCSFRTISVAARFKEFGIAIRIPQNETGLVAFYVITDILFSAIVPHMLQIRHKRVRAQIEHRLRPWWFSKSSKFEEIWARTHIKRHRIRICVIFIFDSRHYQKKVVGLERGPLSLVSTTEELLDRKVAAPVYKTENTDVEIRHADHVAPFIRKSWQSLRRQEAVARSVQFARGLRPWSLFVLFVCYFHLLVSPLV